VLHAGPEVGADQVERAGAHYARVGDINGPSRNLRPFPTVPEPWLPFRAAVPPPPIQQRGSGAHGRNGRDPAVDQEVCPNDVRRIIRREVNCQLRDLQRSGDPLAWIVGSEDALNRIALLVAWEATEHRRVRRAWAQGIHANPAAYEFGAEDSSEMDDRGLAGRDGRGCRPPLARANGRIDDYRRASPEQRQGFLNREVSPFEID